MFAKECSVLYLSLVEHYAVQLTYQHETHTHPTHHTLSSHIYILVSCYLATTILVLATTIMAVPIALNPNPNIMWNC